MTTLLDNDTISILLPTRQRPHQLVRMADSILDTADQPDKIEVVVYIDDDDLSSYDDVDHPAIKTWLSGPRYHDGAVNLSVKWNHCYNAATGDILMHCGDDIIFRTPGWDTVVRKEFEAVPDKVLFVFGDDGYQTGNNFGTHGFIHRKWVQAVEFFVPPYFVSDYNDSFLNDVSKLVGRHKEIPIFTEHMHYMAGKAEVDQNTRERLERHEESRPQDLYASPQVQQEIRDAADKLRALMAKPKRRKKAKGPRLSILIATVGERADRFQRLVEKLTPQVEAHPGQIEVLVFWNNFERPIAEIRQALVDEATGEYVFFVDDDDDVPDYYCDRIMAATESRPDYVGWKMQLWYDGVKAKPTFHSIRYSEWWDDAEGYYRNISHLNPIKREIAVRIPFTGHAGPEDYCWSALVAPLVHTEEYIEESMYFYHYDSTDSIWQGGASSGSYTRPELPEHFRYHPDSKSEFIA